jgi:hypothetical protein
MKWYVLDNSCQNNEDNIPVGATLYITLQGCCINGLGTANCNYVDVCEPTDTVTLDPTLSPTLSPSFSPTMGATPTVSKETSMEPTGFVEKSSSSSNAEEVGSNDFQFGWYRKEVVSKCDEVIGTGANTSCRKTCVDETFIYNGDILISQTEGEEYNVAC